jgi:hypothetical protein
VKLPHLYTGDDGESHFADLELKLAPERGLGGVLELLSPVQGIAFREVPAGWIADYHNAPRRQVVVNLTGRGEIVCGDGTSRIFGPGQAFLADDVTGRGHVSREVEGPRTQLFVYVDPELDLDTLCVG